MNLAWKTLPESEADAAWAAFYSRFRFRPSSYAIDFPGIQEPVPSKTYRLPEIDRPCARDRFCELELDLSSKALRAFQSIIPAGETLIALDWQHECFVFDPHQLDSSDDLDAWEIPILPDGEYSIFLSADMRLGLFGHPWEQTICVFGQELLDAFELDPPALFRKPISVNGRCSSRRKFHPPAKIV